MIRVYELQQVGYVLVATIDETDASVEGDSTLAKYFRDSFSEMEDRGYDPVDHMDSIKSRLKDNWRDGYTHVTFT